MKRIVQIMSVIFCILLSVGGLILAETESNTDVIERIGVKGPLEFNKTIFELAWSDKPDDTYYAQEYLPAGENLETFNQMLAIHLFVKNITAKSAALNKATELAIKMGKNGLVYLKGNADEKTFVLDFTVTEKKLVEYNLYRYQDIDVDGKKGLLVYMYCKRGYGKDIKPFLKVLKEVSTDLQNEMFSTEIPVVTMENK